MGLSPYNVDFPNQKNQAGDELALAIEEFTGKVEGTIKRRSVISNYFPIQTVKGTSTITNKAVGSATLQKLVPGVTPDGVPMDVSKITVTVDTVILARNVEPLLDSFQTDFNFRAEVGMEQGKAHAKKLDQSFFIQGIKAARLAASPYGSDGHLGGSAVTLATADRADPAKLYDAIARMLKLMEDKDVAPGEDDIAIFMRPGDFYNLVQAEQIVNGEYITSHGTKIEGAMIFKMFGCPVFKTNDLPNGVVTGHELSNARNSNAYDGDFSDVVALAIAPKALLSGQSIPLQTKVFFDDLSKCWFIDSWCAYAMTPNRPEYAGLVSVV